MKRLVNNAKNEKRSQSRHIAVVTRQKDKAIFLKIAGILLALIVLSGTALCLLEYFNIINIPLFSSILDSITNADSYDIEKNIPETDTTGFVFYQSPEENISQDAGTGVAFIDNEVLVTLTSENYRSQLEGYLSIIGGRIAGEIPELAEYQIVLEKDYNYAEIQNLVGDIARFGWVLSAAPNYIMEMDASYIPNDSKWRNKWDSIPDGNNWGMEAINAPGAWDYQNQMQTFNIGLLDDMFDVGHPDLNFAEMPLRNELALSAVKNKSLDWSSHGTHTAGTIAALFDNNKGVTGVSIKTNLYGVSAIGLSTAGKCSSQAWNIALYYLIAEKRCSVVNISRTFDQLTFEASRGESGATEVLKLMSQEIEKFLKTLVEKGYPFVICKAAGNQNEVGGSYQYFKKDAGDENTPWSYYSYKDYKEYLNGDKTNEAMFSRYKNRKKEIQGRLESGNVDAKYDILGAISDESVRNRIIMVGAAQNSGTHNEGGFFGIGGTKVHDGYTVAPFSQCGEIVDVIAPGVDIYSTVKNGYGKMSGTSMASPHVAGVAGLIFSVNPDIDADAVKKIIRNTATGEYSNEKYGLVNAANAVEAALDCKPESPEENPSNQSDKSNIPLDAVEFNGHYYYLFDVAGQSASENNTWDNAREYCESIGGYMATITSREENDFLYNYMCQCGYDSAYFGLIYTGAENKWSWCNGEAISYTNWAPGEPNNDGNGEKYGMFYWKYTDGAWNDGDFGNLTDQGGTAFLCEWGDEPNGVEDSTTDRQPITLQQVVAAMKAAARFYDEWIYSTRDLDIRDVLDMGTPEYYYAVNAPGIQSLDDWKNIARNYYSSDVVDELAGRTWCTDIPVWIERDGKLYHTPGLEKPMSIDQYYVELLSATDSQAKVVVYEKRCYENYLLAPYTITCTIEGGRYILDKAFQFPWGEPGFVDYEDYTPVVE